jgi:hypothetical protein
MTEESTTDPWEVAKAIGPFFDGVFPLKGKVAFQKEWYRQARKSKDGIKEYAKDWEGHNYAVYLETIFVLDCDVEGSYELKQELVILEELLGQFKPAFVVVTGKQRYHIYCDAKGREIHSQKLTDHTHIKGWHGYVVGPGSRHPETQKPYQICDKDAHNDPRSLTELAHETLDRLAAKRIACSTNGRGKKNIVTFNLGAGSDVFDLEHPPCIRKLMLQGAPTDQDYVQANHTIARYVISAGLTDGDGAEIASKMTINTSPEHPTSKDTHDKVYNFRSCISSARNYPENNQFECSYVRGSRELIAGNLCRGCSKEEDTREDIPADLKTLIRARAVHELQHGDPFQYCFDAYQQSHASDAELGKVTLLSIVDQSVLNSIGIFPKATGSSGKGKTSGKTAIVHLVPSKYVFKRSFSDKALFYLKLPPEAILFFDDRTLSEGMEELVRCVMDDFQGTKQHTSVHEGKSHTLTIPPRCMVMFTNVDSSLNIQTANRTVDVTVDESEAADLAVHEIAVKRAEMGAPKYPETFEVMVCREMFRIIKEEIDPFRVVVPYAGFINWPGKGNRRNFDIFVDFIHGFAAFRCMQRKTREGVVFADVRDFDDAVALYRSLSKTQTSKLTKRDWLVLQAIFDNGKSATMKELVEALKPHHLSYYTIRDIIKGRKNKISGLLDKVDGLTVTLVRENWQDANDDTHSRSTNEDVFTLPDDFEILAIYDQGGAITLSKGAEDVDLNELDLWKPLTTLTSVDVSLTDVCQSEKFSKLAPIEELDSVIERYKQQLQQKTIAFAKNSEREATDAPPPQSGSQADEEAGDHDLILQNPVKASKQPVSGKNGDDQGAKILNKDGIDDKVFYPNLVKEADNLHSDFDVSTRLGYVGGLSGSVPLDTTHPHTDDEFLWFFEHELMLFKLCGEREKNSERFVSDDDVYLEIIKRVSDKRHLHLDDIVQAGNRLRDHPTIVRELDNIFNRTPRGKADGPKLME